MRTNRVAALSIVLAVVVLLLPSAASAGSVLKVPADYPTIQSAVDAAAPGDMIVVAPGTYSEQVVIAKDVAIRGAGAGSTTIKAPQALTPGPFAGRRSIVTVMNGAKASVSFLRVSGPGTAACGSPQSLNEGVLVVQDATLDLRSAGVTDIHDTPVADCQSGQAYYAIQVGLLGFQAGGPSSGHATIDHDSISDYGVVGIAVSSSGSTAQITHNHITGMGIQRRVPQYGVFVRFGAVASVIGNTITDNRCDSAFHHCGPDPLRQNQSSGIAVPFAGPGTIIANNLLSGNDAGLYLLAPTNCCSISHNTLTGNRYFGELIQDGDATISGDSISGGQVGVAVAAFSADATGVLQGVSITGTSVAPTEELSCCGFTAHVVVQP